MSQFEGTHGSFLQNPSLRVLCTVLLSSSTGELGNAPSAEVGSSGTAPCGGQELHSPSHTDPEMWVPPHSRAGVGSLWLWGQFAQVPTLHKELFAIISWSYLAELLPRGARRYRPLQQPLQPSVLILEFSASSKFWSTGGFPLFFPLQRVPDWWGWIKTSTSNAAW